MGVYRRADPLGCNISVLSISLGADRRRDTMNYHLISVFVLTFSFLGESGVQPVLVALDPTMNLNLICLPLNFL